MRIYKISQETHGFQEDLYHGGVDIGEDINDVGLRGGRSGAIFFTPSKEYARRYMKSPRGLYRYHVPIGSRIFDIMDDGCIDQFINGSVNWEGYDDVGVARRDAIEMIRSMRDSVSHGALDWVTGSQYMDEMMRSGFDGVKFLERPGEIEGMEDGSYKISGDPIYSYGMFADTIKVERV